MTSKADEYKLWRCETETNRKAVKEDMVVFAC